VIDCNWLATILLQVTHWRVLRDHSNGVYHFQAYADLAWGYVPVAEAAVNKRPLSENIWDGRRQQGIGSYSVPLNLANLGVVATDMSGRF
jgi:hypothetical protein